MQDSPAVLLIVVGGIFLTAGLLMMLKPPAKVNSLYGYRTLMSMKNQDTWREGNRFSSRLMAGIGFGDLFIGILMTFVDHGSGVGMISGILIIVVSAFLVVIITEQHLKKIFDNEGKRRS